MLCSRRCFGSEKLGPGAAGAARLGKTVNLLRRVLCPQRFRERRRRGQRVWPVVAPSSSTARCGQGPPWAALAPQFARLFLGQSQTRTKADSPACVRGSSDRTRRHENGAPALSRFKPATYNFCMLCLQKAAPRAPRCRSGAHRSRSDAPLNPEHPCDRYSCCWRRPAPRKRM